MLNRVFAKNYNKISLHLYRGRWVGERTTHSLRG